MFSDIIFPKIEKDPEIGVFDDNTDMDEEEKTFRPYLQIFRNSEIIHNSLMTNSSKQVKNYHKSDISCWFDINCEVKKTKVFSLVEYFFILKVSDDILIRCKHFYSNEIRYPIFRVMMNTGFMFDNVVRFYKRDLDFSANTFVNENFFIDIFFDLSQSNEKTSGILIKF